MSGSTRPFSSRWTGAPDAVSCARPRRRAIDMSHPHQPIDRILEALQERAKELNCLYQVDERINQPDTPPDEIFRGIIQVIPPGYQYPNVCQARLVVEDTVYQPPGFQETSWVQTAAIVVQGAVL